MKKKNHMLFLLLLLGVAMGVTAQINTNLTPAQEAELETHAYKATGGTGVYKDVIYWLDWSKRKRADGSTPQNDYVSGAWAGNRSLIKNGDYLEFIAKDSRMHYKLTVSEVNYSQHPSTAGDGIEQSHPYVTNYNDWGGNNFMYAYNWKDGGAVHNNVSDKYISIRANRSAGSSFVITIEASIEGNEVHDFAFVLAGSESLGRTAEFYSLEMLKNPGEADFKPDQIHKEVRKWKSETLLVVIPKEI